MEKGACANWRIFTLQIMRNKRKLKMTKNRKISVTDDLTYKEIILDRKLREIASQIRNKNVKVEYQYLIIDELKWRWSHTRKKLEK